MNKIALFFQKTKPFINKYTITILLFVVFMLVGKYSIVERIKLTRSINELQREKAKYEKDILNARKELDQLNNMNENLEKMAREKYLMRKQNEEVFILDEDKLKIDK